MPTTILFNLLTVVVVKANTDNEQKTKETNHGLTRIFKQVTFDLFDRYFLSKSNGRALTLPCMF